jgi:hypothetical protein
LQRPMDPVAEVLLPLLASIMFRNAEAIQLSASDLVGHLNCGYLADLDIAVPMVCLRSPKSGTIRHWKSSGNEGPP